MTDAPSRPPIDDEDEGDEAKLPPAEFTYGRKRPRNLAIVFAIIIILILMAATGFVKAIISGTEDPEKIKFPDHVSKSLDEHLQEDGTGQPASSDQTVSEPYQALDANQDQLIVTPEASQTESTLDLNQSSETPATPAEQPAPQVETPVNGDQKGDVKVDEKKFQAGPQSMIRWDRLPQVSQQNKSSKNKGVPPQIVVVIDDMGLNHRNSKAVASMSGSLTLAYLPYASNLPAQTAQARQNGHELIVHMPMEPDNIKQNNPGPDALLTSNSPDENVRRLDKNLSSFTGYIGINNHMGSHMTANADAIRPVMRNLKQRGLWFLDSRTIGNSVAGKVAEEYGVPYVTRDVFLDNVASIPAVLKQLRQVEIVAKQRGYAVAIGHPHDATIAALKQWLPSVQAKGFQLVPLSTVIAERFPSATIPQYALVKKEAPFNGNDIEPAAGGMTVPAFSVRASSLHGTSQLQ